MAAADLWTTLDELVVLLRGVGEHSMASVLDHRLHKVAWNSRWELLRELERVFDEQGSRLAGLPVDVGGRWRQARAAVLHELRQR